MQFLAELNNYLNAHGNIIMIMFFLLSQIILCVALYRKEPSSKGRVRADIVNVGTQNTSGRLKYHKLLAEGYEIVARTEKGVFTMRKYHIYA